MPRLIGYARVSTQDQDLSLQIDALKQHGILQENIYQDKISGSKKERPGLQPCLKSLVPGDTLVVWKLDRLGRSLQDLIQIVQDLKKRGVGLKSITESIDTTSPGGNLIFHMFGALAQFEREIIKERTGAGLRSARAKGRVGGRPKITANHSSVRSVKQMHENGCDPSQIAEVLGLSKRTVYRRLSY